MECPVITDMGSFFESIIKGVCVGGGGAYFAALDITLFELYHAR